MERAVVDFADRDQVDRIVALKGSGCPNLLDNDLGFFRGSRYAAAECMKRSNGQSFAVGKRAQTGVALGLYPDAGRIVDRR